MSEERELSKEELEGIDGGLVVKFAGDYYLVNDKTGEKICGLSNLTNVDLVARHRGASPEVISKGEYEIRFGRRFKR